MDYLQNLNPNQELAVTTVEGPLLVVAGAGSGKTRVLTTRIAHLIKAHHIPPYRIAAVTFTNKAAQEMRDRLHTLIGPSAGQVVMGTFHSLCVRILRSEAAYAGYGPGFQIFDEGEQLAVIREVCKELNLDPQRIPPRGLLGAISRAKDELITPEEYPAGGDYWEQIVVKVYAKYQEKLMASNALDFDDLIMAVVRMFQRHPEVKRKYQERFDHILVDEYQDTNKAQYVLVHMLAQRTGNICVVGDEDQSIYAFRGADIRNILEFERDFPGATVVKLEENYRSTQNILGAANSVIKNNTERKEKRLWTKRAEGDKVVFFQGATEWEEARFTAEAIRELQKRDGRAFRDVAILYRTHALSRVLEEEFMRSGVPYRIIAGLRFYDRKEIKDLMAYLRLVHNPHNDISFLRVVNTPRRGIGDVTITRLTAYAQQFGISLFSALSYLDGVDGLGGKAVRALQGFKELVDGWHSRLDELTVTELVTAVLEESGYLGELQAQRDRDAQERLENLKEFLSLAQQFEDLGTLLEYVALISDVDTYDAEADAVSMMTVHASKGLEFPVVFIVGLEEGLFPHARSAEEAGQLEEERRLMYVAMTRAQERLFLTCAGQRTLFGATRLNAVSSFVGEIDPQYLEEKGAGVPSLPRMTTAPARPARGAGAEYGVGDKVEHKIWGRGMVVAVSDSGGDLLLTIAFPNQGLKKVMAHLAPITKV